MKKGNARNLWVYREARQATIKEHFLLIVLVIAGLISIVRLANWWFHKDHIGSLPLFILLSLIFWYGIVRIILIWINYLNIEKPQTAAPIPGFKRGHFHYKFARRTVKYV